MIILEILLLISFQYIIAFFIIRYYILLLDV